MIPIRATRINANKTSMIIIPTGLSLSPPPQLPQSLQFWSPPQQEVVGGRQSQSQQPPAGAGAGVGR